MNVRWPSGVALLLTLVGVAPAEAQARKHSWEAAAGAVWFSGADLGTVPAS